MEPITIFFALAALTVSFVLVGALQKSQPPPEPASLQDFKFPQKDEGTPQAVVFGDVWLDGWFVIAYGNLRSIPIKSGGGKK